MHYVCIKNIMYYVYTPSPTYLHQRNKNVKERGNHQHLNKMSLLSELTPPLMNLTQGSKQMYRNMLIYSRYCCNYLLAGVR